MKIEGYRDVNSSAKVVWDFITNAGNMAGCLPGAKSPEVVDDKTIKAQMKVGVGFVKETFDSAIKFSEIDEAGRNLKITINARAKSDTATMNIDVHIDGDDSKSTLKWTVEAVMAGKLASVGQRYLSKASDKVIEQSFECMMSKLA